MSDLATGMWIELGILFSLVIPFAKAVLFPPPASGESTATPTWREKALDWFLYLGRRYIPYLLASVVMAILFVMFLRWRQITDVKTEYDAFFVGFFAETMFTKLLREKAIGEVSRPN